MGMVSLISLVVDYEVPPIDIVEAITLGKLHPIVTDDGSISLENIAFASEEVLDLFWAYDLKAKSADARAELARRFQRYDAIVAAIIGAVVGSGAVALVGGVTGKRGARSPGSQHARTIPPVQCEGRYPQDFREPVDSTRATYDFHFSNSDVTIIRTDDWTRRRGFKLLAAADGTRVGILPFPTSSRRQIFIRHTEDWYTLYECRGGHIAQAVPVGMTVVRGQRIGVCRSRASVAPRAVFSMWHRNANRDPLVRTSVRGLDWEGFPGRLYSE